MRIQQYLMFGTCLTLSLTLSSALANRYVAQAGQEPLHPYDSWSNAASNIAAALSASLEGERIWISNGLYQVSSTITLNRSQELVAAEGNSDVILDGGGSQRILAISVGQAMDVLVQGLVFTNGYHGSAGGGIRIDHTASVEATVTLRNCLVTHCGGPTGVFDSKGGGIRVQGRSDSDGLFVHLDRCDLVHNFAGSRSGGIKLIRARFLIDNSRIAHNRTSGWDPFAEPPQEDVNLRWGGGIFVERAESGSIIRNSIVEHNRVNAHGGGVSVRFNGFLLENTIIRNNLAGMGGGFHIDSTLNTGTDPMILRNCLIHGNTTVTNAALTNPGFANGGGVRLGRYPQSHVDGVKDTWIQNTTLTGNEAFGQAGGIYTSGGRNDKDPPEGDLDTILINSIVYDNWALGTPARSNVFFNTEGPPSTYWVTNSLVGTETVLPGSGNITDQSPRFVDATASNYRLDQGSPAINAGYYQAWMDDAVDLDNKPRIDSFSGTVDIGCYAYRVGGSVILVR